MAIESIVEKLIIPKIDEITDWCKDKYNEYMIPKAEHFQEYLERTYEKYSIINTLVFHNSQRQLKDIYIAQTLVNKYISDREFRYIKIDKLPVELIIKYKKILITDTAGMGKSTIMKRMFIDLIDGGIENLGIPIYIELNRLKRDHTILMEIHEELSSLLNEFDKKLYLKLIQTGGFIFFMDGFDEISIADKKDVIHDIQSFISRAGTKNYYIMTSRHEDSLRSFGDFQSFSIQPLTKDEAFELLRKYDLSRNQQLSKKLIQLLRSGEYNSIDEYLENPLLVSLLYSAFDHKQTIPLKKHQFYRQVYDAYFDTHDLTKGMDARQKRSGLDIDDFNRVLRYVGYECLMRLGVRFDEDTILGSINRARAFCGNLMFGNKVFLEDLLIAVPLFSKDGTEFKWAHKSLMEYFAARFIAEDAKENQDKILSAIYDSENFEKYYNLLDIYYDVDYKGFSKNLTLPFCKHFLQFLEDNPFDLSSISEYLIEERKSCLFFGSFLFVVIHGKKYTKSLIDFFGEQGVELSHGTLISQSSIQYVDNEYVYSVAIMRKSINYMTRLLYNKRSAIIRDCSDSKNHVSHQLILEGLPREFKDFEHDTVFVVDINTGSQSEKIYDGVNLIIRQHLNMLTDYKDCKKEVDRIEMEIAQSEDASVLLAGI